jgi:hypothetical protein
MANFEFPLFSCRQLRYDLLQINLGVRLGALFNQ